MNKMPNSWKLLTLGDVANWTSGGTPSSKNSDYYGGDIPWVCIGDLNEGSVLETAKKITKAGLDSSSAKIMPKGTIMLAMYATSIGDTGMMETNMATNQAIACGVPNPEMIVGKYLLYYLQSQKHEFFAAGRGGAQPNINQGIVKAWPIPVPSIDEQHKIVELLEDHVSRLDAALVDIRQAKSKAAQFRRSLLQLAFKGNLGSDETSFMTEWPVSNLSELCTFITDGSHNPPKGVEHSEFYMLSSRDIQNGKLTFEKPRFLSAQDFAIENKRTNLKVGDVLLTTVGTIGRTAVYKGNPEYVTFQRSVSVLRPNQQMITSKYLMYFLDSITELLNREARGVAQQGIYLNQVRKLNVPVPRLDEQNKIVELLEDHLSRLDVSVSLADDMEKQSNALRRSLLQAAFSGQLTKEVLSV